mgnify:FL=1
MPQVHVVEPVHSHEPAKLRVCAYARVSSDSADQLNSFASQVRYYTNLIAGNEDWTLVDIYADRGITGTSTAKRTEFQRMMEDCREGKIDRILVKSLSRFARNTQDCIAALRELRQLGVTVVFEKEHINTGTMANEMLISMMSAFAQEESVSISKNMRKGVQMRMQNGTYRTPCAPFGYRLGDRGLVIEPNEAEIVKRIFREFISGKSTLSIATELQQEAIPKRYGNPIWTKKGVTYILSNEKYVGDELLQKSMAAEVFPYQRALNNGQAKQYYKELAHEPIISRDTFAHAQGLLAQRRSQFGHSQKSHSSALTKILVCGHCGAPLYHRFVNKCDVWVCAHHLSQASVCPLSPVTEDELTELFNRLVYKLTDASCPVLKTYLAELHRIQQYVASQQPEIAPLRQQVAQLLEQSHTLNRLMASGCIDSAFFIAHSNTIQQSLDKVKGMLARQRETDLVKENIDSTLRLQAVLSTIKPFEGNASRIPEFVTWIKVSEDHVIFHLTNDLELREERRKV